MYDIFEKTLQLVQQTYPKTRRSDTQHFGSEYSEKFELRYREIETYLSYHRNKRTFHTTSWSIDELWKENCDFAQNITDSLQRVIEEIKWEGFIFPIIDKRHGDYPPGKIIAYGSKAVFTRDLIDRLNMHYNIRCSKGKARLETECSVYEIDWDIENESIFLKSDEKDTEILKTIEDVESFVIKEKEIGNAILNAEQSIITYTQKIETTSYRHQTVGGSIFINLFGIKVPFELTKVGTMNSPKFRLDFGKNQLTVSTISELENQAKEKIKSYINKHRLKAVTSSDYDIVERHLAFMFGNRVSKGQFLKLIVSEVPTHEIMEIIRRAEPGEVIKNEKNEAFLRYLKNGNYSYKLKSSFQINNLLIFITANKCFVFQENVD